jgi:hypothetical protein
MGSVFIFWDKLFGTFQEELPAAEYEPIRYGLTTPLEKETIPAIIFHEWSAIWQDLHRPGLNWKQKWLYVFGPPGWSHDGSRKTSSALRDMLKKNTERPVRFPTLKPTRQTLQVERNA